MVRRSYVVAVGLIVACSGGGSSPDAPEAIPPSTPPGLPKGPPSIVVENRTSTAVVLQVRPALDLQIDRRVLLGDLSIPIAPAAFLPANGEVIRPGSSMTLMNTVRVVDAAPPGRGVVPTLGAILGFADRPATLAVGEGTLFVRSSEDGSPTLEAKDPRTLTLVPVERAMPACGEAEIGTRFDGLPTDLKPLYGTAPITEVVRDSSGCRIFHFTHPTDMTPASVRACLPDEAFPFAEDDTLTIGAGAAGNASVRIQNQLAVRIQLLHAQGAANGTAYPIPIFTDVDTRTKCASVDPTCGDVSVPVRIEVRIEGTTVSHPPLRAAIPDPTRPDRTVFVLGAFARPIALLVCDDRPTDQPLYGTDLFLAVVER